MMIRLRFAGLMVGLGLWASVAGAQVAADSSWSGVRAEARELASADSLRRAILGYATFAGFGDTSCSHGDMRTFEGDTTGVVRTLLARLELLVLSHGAYASLDNDAGRALLRAVIRLEGGGPGPRWDTMTGTGLRALNPVLPLSMLNPRTNQCATMVGTEPDGIVLPPVTGLVVPRDSGTSNLTVGYGATGLNELRNFYFARHARDSSAILNSTRVNAHAVWGNYAIIGVLREKQYKGVVPLEKETTGAVYAFHRVGEEWRLLAVIRNW